MRTMAIRRSWVWAGLSVAALLWFGSTMWTGALYAQAAGSKSTSRYRAVLYLTHATEGRRCAGRERVGYRVNPECCPPGFSAVGVRVTGDSADAVCLQD